MALAIENTDAFIVVDMQNDFMPGGALPVPDGDSILPVLNRLLGCFPHRILTRDWHPADHISFASEPSFTDRSWPVHCVRNTPGAAFHKDLQSGLADLVVSKAMNAKQEAYSGFDQTDLSFWLKKRSVRRVFIAGVATEYCVKATAMDARAQGFETFCIRDAVKGVEHPAGASAAALQAMQQAGIQIINSGDIACP